MGEFALLQAIGRGDQKAFEELYSQYRKPLLAYSAGILGGDISLAEDAVDEAFTDIWRLSGRFNQIGNAAAWIRRIVRNKSVDVLRKTSGRETHQSDDFFSNIRDGAHDPEQTALLTSEAHWLRGALAILNTDQREVVTLCYFEGRSLKEIADIAGCPPNTVKTRLHYARRKLFQWMNDQEELHESGATATKTHFPKGQRLVPAH